MCTSLTNPLATKISANPVHGARRCAPARAPRRWLLLAAGAGLFLATAGLTPAQSKSIKTKSFFPPPTPALTDAVLKKHDLEIKSFSGTLVGNTYHLGGTIRNIGQVASPERRVFLYVRSSDYTRWLYANESRVVPPLRPGQEWKIPSFSIAAKNVPTNRFQLVIHTTPGTPARERDGNPQNDERITDAALVR
jgi:hypothetical protein